MSAVSHVMLSQFVSASPAEVWRVVGAPGEIAVWHPAFSESHLEGSHRTCVLVDGPEIHEEILEHDGDGRWYRYTVTDSPLPMRDYISVLSVEPAENGARLSWKGDFHAAGAPVEEVEAMVRGVYEAGLQSVASRFVAGAA